MNIVIDLSGIPFNNPFAFAWWLFINVGWIVPVFLIIWAILMFWQNWLKTKYREKRKYILLAIDVPKNLENSPQNIENIFNQLSGAQMGVGRMEKWWTGEIPDSFSFEIISSGGYLQFLVHTCAQYRDLIEAIVYAQYPDAEIVEVEDYTKDFKFRFPTSEYELWGTELKLAKKDFYPIKTYPEFEHSKEGYKDSMAGILEALTRLGPDEQAWIQFVVTPADNDWADKAKPEVKKLIGAKVETKKNVMDKAIEMPEKIVTSAISMMSAPSEGGGKSESKEEPTKLQHMTHGEKVVVEAVEKKISKIGFNTKIRLIYLAKKVSFNSTIPKVLIGSFRQFSTLNLNSFKADGKTKTGGVLFFKKSRLATRKNKMLFRYKNRGHYLEPGTYGQILNSEELATLYHFPTLNVKAPMLKKSEAKKAEPPMRLPVGDYNPIKKKSEPISKAEPPSDLPIN